jgi:hypothetical protein
MPYAGFEPTITATKQSRRTPQTARPLKSAFICLILVYLTTLDE